MSTRGPQRWCPDCRGQIYFHHSNLDLGQADVWYCQGCAKEIAEEKVLHAVDQLVTRKENHGGTH